MINTIEMKSETQLELPVIDFPELGLCCGTSIWNTVKAQVHQALEQYGCFEASFNKVDLELRKLILNASKEMFELPLETKSKHSSETPFHGYVGNNPRIPLYESMSVLDPTMLENAQSFSNLMWPEGNSTFCNTIHSFSKQLSNLDAMIRRMVLESLGIEKYFVEHIRSTDYFFSFMKYEGTQSKETKVGIYDHTDKNLITILYQQNQVDGLQVQTRNNVDRWIDVKPSPGSFIVIVGDTFKAWTNGRLHSPYHRVTVKGSENRYSIGLFTIPKKGYIIKAPEEFVDEEHPLLFNPFEYYEFLSFNYSEAGQSDQFALQTYCGVNY